MIIENMPGCCTSAILFSLGEHGEKSLVTVEEVKLLVATKTRTMRDPKGEVIVMGKKCIFAISVDPKNIRVLEKAGFRVIDSYRGVQGIVHILTLHLEEGMQSREQ